MSDDLNTPNAEGELEESEAQDGEESGGKTERARPVANPLSRPSDAASRPGFRSPANARSKAQKKGKKKR